MGTKITANLISTMSSVGTLKENFYINTSIFTALPQNKNNSDIMSMSVYDSIGSNHPHSTNYILLMPPLPHQNKEGADLNGKS